MPKLTTKEVYILMFASGLFMGYAGAHTPTMLGGAIGILIMMFILRKK